MQFNNANNNTTQFQTASNPNVIADKPIGGSFANNLERDRIASELGSVSSGSQGFYIGQDFYNPQLGLKGLKLTPARRSLLDDINGKKWKKLSKVGKNDLHDRSAPNFYIRENSVLPEATPARKNLLADIDGKKWKKLSKVGKDDLHDRSGPQLHLRSEFIPDKTPQSRALMADIDGKKWKKLSAVPKDRMRDRSAANLALWSIEKSAINPDYEKKYAKANKNAYQSDFYRGVQTDFAKAPVSDSHEANGVGSRPMISHPFQQRQQVAQGHLHSDVNSSFPVAEGHTLRHATDAPAVWSGNTLGQKMSSLGKGFTGWIKEEATEIKEAVTGLGKKHHDVDHNLNAAPATAAETVAPGSSVTSGLKPAPVVDSRLGNNVYDNTVVRANDKTIY